MTNNRLIILASALLVVAGCSVEQAFENESELKQQEAGQEITIHATLQDDYDTKTMRNASSGAVLWVPGDAISLFYGSGTDGGSRFASTATDVCDVTNFTGTITAITGGANISLEDTYFWGVYPYQNDASCDGSSVTITLPSHQTATPGTFATGLFPSLGRSQGLTMGFYNICGGWRFSVTKEGVRKVTLKSNGGESISGRVKVGLNESGIPVIREIIDGSDEVVLECPTGEYFEVGQNYYMVLLPTVMSSGFTMTFETYTEEGTYNRTASTTINRSNFIGITNLDNYLTTPYALKTGNIPIPDANFKAYMVSNFDTNSDCEISYEEATDINEIELSNIDNISSLRGLEYCTSLSYLTCIGMNLTSLDVSNNKGLYYLYCGGNLLTSLDVSYNTALTYFYCSNNLISSLDLSNNTELFFFDCSNNQLTTIDLSNNLALEEFCCSRNQLTSLDISNNIALSKLKSSNNQLTSLDLSNSIKLRYLDCSYNQLSSLIISNLAWLEGLECYYNQLTNLDVSDNLALNSLECCNNQLASLDVSNNTALVTLYCHDNQIRNLDVSNNTALVTLSCDNNQINNLDVSNNTTLTGLTCSNNLLSSLDVSLNTALITLSCSNNQLANIDVSLITALEYLYCNGNHLTSIDVSNNTALKCFGCDNNLLASLDVSLNTALELLLCGNNQLTTLDVSNNQALYYLVCSPMASLETLKIAQGQELFNITSNRSEFHIPASTQIVVAPSSGGNEGTGDNEVTP